MPRGHRDGAIGVSFVKREVLPSRCIDENLPLGEERGQNARYEAVEQVANAWAR